MAKLIIKRTSEWNNRMRDMGVYLDEQKIGTIRNNEIKKFEIEPGEHQLSAKIDWCRSKTISFNSIENKTQKYELTGFRHGKWIVPITFLIILINFGLRLFWNFEEIYFLIFIVHLFAYIFYYLTFGSNKYLRFKKR